MLTTPKFQKTRFKNGLTLLSERLRGFRGLSLGVWVKVGTRHETRPLNGVSHFLEHMLFKGTKERTALQIARQVDRIGGEFNAFTAREHTCFHLFLLDRDFRFGLDILSDVLLNTHFHRLDVERERGVILQEIAMVDDSPEELAHDLFYEKIYGSHPLGANILGTTKSIKKMRRTDLFRYFRERYRPDQIIFSVAGDISHRDVVAELKHLEEPWPGRPRQPRSWAESPAPPLQSGFWWAERPTEQVHLVWGVAGLPYASPDRFAAFLLNVYLGGGMSSTLFQEIREKNGLAYTVYSTLLPFVDSGIFSVYSATHVAQVPLCLKLIEKCVAQLKEKALSKKELRVIQDNLKSSILLSSDSAESRMASIAKNEIFLGKYTSVEETCREIDQVTPADIKRLAAQLFQSDQRSILAVGPKPSAATIKAFKPQFLRV